MSYTNNFFNCLNCRNELSRRVSRDGFLYRCDSCHSYAASVPLLRKALPLALVNQLWNDARTATVRMGRGCPLCKSGMVARASHQGQVLEVCPSCRIVWFDPGDYPGDPARLEQQFRGDQLSAKAREVLAIAEVKSIREQAEREERHDSFLHGLLRSFSRGGGRFRRF